MATRRKLDDALDYGRQLQSVHELQAAGASAAPEDIVAILDVSEVDADAQPKKITLQDLVTAAGGGSATPAGNAGEIQINDGAVPPNLGAVTDFKWDSVDGALDVPGDINLTDGGTYSTTLQTITPTADRVISFPDATGTVGLVAGSSGQLIYNNAGALAGTEATYNSTTGYRFVLPFGYGAGAGGTVTQATSKSTGVTLNTRCGQITMNAAELAADTAVSFTLTNSQVAAGDVIITNHVSGGTVGAYYFGARSAAGSATLTLRNLTAGALSEAVVIAFAVIKASTT